jgi:hypothetical protein
MRCSVSAVARWGPTKPRLDKPTLKALFTPAIIGECSMASKADEYRERAAMCRQQAAETPHIEFKEEFARLAEKWSQLAEEEENQIMQNATSTTGELRLSQTGDRRAAGA